MQEYEVLLLVGAGIGVTPFASVLADLVNRMESQRCRLCGEVGHAKEIETKNPEVASWKQVPKVCTHRSFFYACSSKYNGFPPLFCNQVVPSFLIPKHVNI